MCLLINLLKDATDFLDDVLFNSNSFSWMTLSTKILTPLFFYYTNNTEIVLLQHLI